MARPIYLLSPSPREGTLSLPIIKFTLSASKIDFSKCDSLLFTSKQAVLSAEAIDKSWKNYPCIAIGPATKKQIEILGGKVLYFPEKFYAKTLASEIVQKFHTLKLLYLRPKTVSFDTKTFLAQAGIVLEEQIIYETECRHYGKSQKPDKNAVIIFTSPSSIKCFFNNFNWDESYTAVVIGEATKVHLPQNVKYRVSDTPLIASCIEKAKEI